MISMCLLEVSLLLLSIGASGLSAYFVCLATNWTFFWVGILLLPFAYLLLFALWVVFLFLWGKCFNTKKEKEHFSPFYYSIIRNTDIAFLHLINVGYRRQGFEQFPKGHDYVLVCNHVSNFDQMILIAALKRENQPMAWITKPENMSFPIAGPFIHHAGFIPIDRENPIKGLKAIKKGVNYLSSHQCAMGICPEGTRNKTNEPLLEFHPGSFKMAMWANVPIVVCSLKKTSDIKKRSPWKHTTVLINIVDVIYPEEYKNKTTNEISARARDAILKDLERNKL